MTDEIPVKKILLLSANPKGTKQLRLNEEIHDIKEELQLAKERDRFVIESAEAVRSRDIQRSILNSEPQIVHFSGHGAGEPGLIFEDNTGQQKLVDAEALAGLFELFADKVECVLLNACYSEIQAKAIAQHINYVIGMSQEIGDKAAIEFAAGFYNALFNGKTYEQAYKFGLNAIQMASIPEHLTPQLLRKEDLHGKSIKNTTPVLTSPPQDPRKGTVVSPPPTPLTAPAPRQEETTITIQRQREQQEAEKRRQQEQVEAQRLQRQLEQQEAQRLQLHEKQETDDLPSEKGVDYTKLRDLLAADKWEDADQETLAVMLKATGREEEGYLDYESIANLPCTDLRTIDQLWIQYSKGLFGFSVQKCIWESVGRDYEKLGVSVGWRKKVCANKEWLTYSKLTFSLNAPQGHLPTLGGPGSRCAVRAFRWFSWASDYVKCNI